MARLLVTIVSSNAMAPNSLSALQKKLLEKALRAHYRTPLDIAAGTRCPGCFGLKTMMSAIEDPRARATQRSTAGRAIARLIRRGLVECGPEHGHWRLTKRGLTVTKKLHPDLRPPTRREIARDIALQSAIHAALPASARGRRCRKRPVKATRDPEKVVIAVTSDGIEIPFDY